MCIIYLFIHASISVYRSIILRRPYLFESILLCREVAASFLLVTLKTGLQLAHFCCRFSGTICLVHNPFPNLQTTDGFCALFHHLRKNSHFIGPPKPHYARQLDPNHSHLSKHSQAPIALNIAFGVNLFSALTPVFMSGSRSLNTLPRQIISFRAERSHSARL